MPGGRDPHAPADLLAAALNAVCVLKVLVTSIQPGISTMSLPPQVHYSVGFSSAEALRGPAPEGSQVKLIMWGMDAPFAAGAEVILYGSQQEDMVVYTGCVPSTAPEYARVLEEIKEVPFGWKKDGSALVSPFTAKFTECACPCVAAAKRCSVTGRPALTAGEGVTLKIEQVLPEVIQEYKNPYGDGSFRVTFKNTGSQPACVPVLKDAATGELLLEQSALCIVGETAHAFPQPLPAAVQVARLEPGQELSGTINTLKLPNVEWPCGGSRVYFTFAFGNLVASNFFYYYSSVHDALRDAARA